MNGAYLIAGALLVDGETVRPGSLRVAGGRIAEVLPPEVAAAAAAARHGAELVDGHGRWLIPGGVDPHVHFALPVAGTVTCDDFASGTRAAVRGGTTTVIDFVTPARDASLVEAVEARRREAAGAAAEVLLHASLTRWDAQARDELRICARDLGLRSVKMYLAYRQTVGLPASDIEAAMAECARLDLTVLLHCEDGDAVARHQRDLLAAGHRGPAAHPRSRPPEVEAAAVRSAVAMAHRTGCRLYVVHVSTGGSLDAIRRGRDAGTTVLVETCPHYLYFDASVYDRPFAEAAPFVLSPPLRPCADRDRLRAAVVAGEIDTVASDHCAFTRAQKDLGRDDFTRIPGGAAGVEHRLALLHTLATGDLALPAERWVDLIARRPAEVFGLAPRKGTLAPGADADLVLWDPQATCTVVPLPPYDHTIYDGLTVRGRAERVWLRGVPISTAGH